jgi:ArsR family transcriptional regulator
VVIDFAPHTQNILIEEHAHRRLGLADEEVSAWCEVAGLGSELTRTLKGDPLTVNVWLASHAASITSEAVSEHDSVAAAS